MSHSTSQQGFSSRRSRHTPTELYLIETCPDLDPSDFQLFLRLKELLCGKRFGYDEELEKAGTTWFNELEAEEYDLGILKLENRYDKCLNVGGDYVEK
ncbi:hypothetical protein AVEN_205644-1 [Araneus ventricosus]|uniref:Uncharacterized protein n=1 Tax=Araneus ventricosus TaxID=182803 RepID=A0A4Y2K7C7_ARAVE|nr:hypothetical protein AVEN_205644-1 [Araneus ventricosus]